MPENTTATTGNTASQRYFTIWRWHFYAGIFVAPLLMVLAITGLAMIFFAHTEGKDGEYVYVAPAAQVQPLSRQAQAALNKGGRAKRQSNSIFGAARARYGGNFPRG